ncbi:hypothetical protein [Fervidobacterium sp.]
MKGLFQGIYPLLGLAALLGSAALMVSFGGWGGLLFILLLVFAALLPVADRIFYSERADPLKGLLERRAKGREVHSPEETTQKEEQRP